MGTLAKPAKGGLLDIAGQLVSRTDPCGNASGGVGSRALAPYFAQFGGGAVSPIRFRASRIAGADVSSPGRQSTSGNSFNSVGTATLARGPRFPRDAATHNRTKSSLVPIRDTSSPKILSSSFLGSKLRVSSARCWAAPALIVEVSPVRTVAIVSWSRFFEAAPVDCAAENNAQITITASVAKRSGDNPFFAVFIILVRMEIPSSG